MCLCVFVPLSAQTCNDPVVIRHTAAEKGNEEDMKETAQRGGKALHGALFSKSTPSLEPEKVYSKGQGSPWRHSFCSLCHAVYVFKTVCVCFYQQSEPSISPLLFTNCLV